MSHEKLSFKHFLLQQESKQTKASLKNCVICDFYPSKLGLHPENFPSLAYIIKLLKITIKTKTSLLMYIYFLLYVHLCFIFWQIGILIPIWLPLWI